MIATDTNVIAALFLTSSRTTPARAAFQKDGEWIAPALWRSEFRNILAGYCRRRELTVLQATRLAALAERLLERREIPVGSERVLELAEQSGCTAYDCEYVAVAEDASVLLVTDDRQVLRNFPQIAISLDEFAGSCCVAEASATASRSPAATATDWLRAGVLEQDWRGERPTESMRS